MTTSLLVGFSVFTILFVTFECLVFFMKKDQYR
jgi:hypothetical protein